MNRDPQDASLKRTESQDDAPRPAAGGLDRVDRYIVLGELGRGGMGVVLRARDAQLGREVALKLLDPGASASLVERFRREGRTLARLAHPSIVTIHDCGIWEGRPFIAMELVEGRTLAVVLDEDRITPRRAAEWMAQMADAVAHAHAHGIVHRDLKPSNVMIDGWGRPLVMDFGLARNVEVDRTLTETGQVLGTPHYMSPEQARGEHEKVDARTDVHALGVILYEMLTCRLPFEGDEILEVLRRVVHDDPVSPRRFSPQVPREVETICLKAMEKDPARRYGSAAELAADARAFLAGEPIRARPPGLGYRLRKRLVRHRRALAVVALVAATLAGALYWGMVVVPALRKERDEGRAARHDEQELVRVEARLEEARRLAAGGRLDRAVEIFRSLETGPELRTARGSEQREVILARGRRRLSREIFAAPRPAGTEREARRGLAMRALAYSYYYLDPGSTNGMRALLGVGSLFAKDLQFDRALAFFEKVARRADRSSALFHEATLESVRMALVQGRFWKALRLVSTLELGVLAPEPARVAGRVRPAIELLSPASVVPLHLSGQVDVRDAVVADVDGDGRNELVTIDRMGDLTVFRFEDRGNVRVLWAGRVAGGGPFESVRLASGNLDGDPAREILVGIGCPRQSITRLDLWKWQGNRLRRQPLRWADGASMPWDSRGDYCMALRITDVDGDGRPDLVMAWGWYGFNAGVGLRSADGAFRYHPLPWPEESGPRGAYEVLDVWQAGPGAARIALGLSGGNGIVVWRFDPVRRRWIEEARRRGHRTKALAFVPGPEARARPLVAAVLYEDSRPMLGRLAILREEQGKLVMVDSFPWSRVAIPINVVQPVLLPVRFRGGGLGLVVSTLEVRQEESYRTWKREPSANSRLLPLLALVAVEPEGRLCLMAPFLAGGQLIAAGDLDEDGDCEVVVSRGGLVHALGLKGAQRPVEPSRRDAPEAPGMESLRAGSDLIDADQYDLARQAIGRLVRRSRNAAERGLARLELARSHVEEAIQSYSRWEARNASRHHRRALRIMAELGRESPELARSAASMRFRLELESCNLDTERGPARAARAADHLLAAARLDSRQAAAVRGWRDDLKGYGSRRNVLSHALDPRRRGFPASSPFVMALRRGGWVHRGGPGVPHAAAMPLGYSGGSFEATCDFTLVKAGWDAPLRIGLAPGEYVDTEAEWTDPRFVLELTCVRDRQFRTLNLSCRFSGAILFKERLRLHGRSPRRLRLTVRYLAPLRGVAFELRDPEAGPLFRRKVRLETHGLVEGLPKGRYHFGFLAGPGSPSVERFNQVLVHDLSLLGAPGVFRFLPWRQTGGELLREGNARFSIGDLRGAIGLYRRARHSGGDQARSLVYEAAALVALAGSAATREAVELRRRALARLERSLAIDARATLVRLAEEARRQQGDLVQLFLRWRGSRWKPVLGEWVEIEEELKRLERGKGGEWRHLRILELLEMQGRLPGGRTVDKELRRIVAFTQLGMFDEAARRFAPLESQAGKRAHQLRVEWLLLLVSAECTTRALDVGTKLLRTHAADANVVKAMIRLNRHLGNPAEVLRLCVALRKLRPGPDAGLLSIEKDCERYLDLQQLEIEEMAKASRYEEEERRRQG